MTRALSLFFTIIFLVFISQSHAQLPPGFKVEITNLPTAPVKVNAGRQLSGKITILDKPAGNALYKMAWNFGDGQTSTGTTPFVMYKAPGNYTVSLTVERTLINAGKVIGTSFANSKAVINVVGTTTATTTTPPVATPGTTSGTTPVGTTPTTPKVPVTIPNQPLFQASNLTYLGAFRVPKGVGFEYGGDALTINDGKLIVACTNVKQMIGEISIPTPSTAKTVAALPTATLTQPCADPMLGSTSTKGYFDSNNAAIVTGYKIGGLLVQDGKLFVNKYAYYDAGYQHKASLFVKPNTNLAEPNAKGVFDIVPEGLETTIGRGGFVSAHVTRIPPEWRIAFGGDVMSGNDSIPIVSRTSYGPSAFSWNTKDVGKADTIATNALLYYTQKNATIGKSDGKGPDNVNIFWNNTGGYRSGAVFPDGFSSVLYFGAQGQTDYCYGPGIKDIALANAQVAGSASHYCYDPAFSAKGTHAYPYQYQILAYDAKDLANAKAKNRKPWETKPYAVWALKGMVGIDGVSNRQLAAAYDPASKRIYLSAANIEANGVPVIYVFQAK